MKRILSLILTLALLASIAALFTTVAAAEVH